MGAEMMSRILLVDDDLLNHKILASFLQGLGYKKVFTACNGLEAINSLKDNQCDIVFMDLNMPIMDGIEATKHIRKTENLSTVYIIAATSNDTPDDRNKCFESGMNSFIRKPYSKTEIQKVLAAAAGIERR